MRSNAASSGSRGFRAEEHLPHERFGGQGRGAQGGVAGGYRAPAQHRLTFLRRDGSENSLAFGALGGVLREEHHANAIFPGRGQRHAGLPGGQLQKLVGGLDQDASAIAGVGLAAAGAAVIQVHQHLQRLLDDGVGLPALDVNHKANAAGLVLELRVVQTLP